MAEAKRIVLAVGGNSLITDPKNLSVHSQYQAAEKTAGHIARMLSGNSHHLAIVHGNGPQVGFILRRSELAKQELHLVPLDSCVADTQGAIGYNLQMALNNQLILTQAHRRTATVVTQVVVDGHDPSFLSPDKPIGSFLDAETAQIRQREDGWTIVEDSGRGYRRVVPSPKPKKIVEIEVIRSLFEQQVIVIAAGGGGIPVVEHPDGRYTGIEAVIDKDLAACLLARELKADVFIITTAVEKAARYFGTPKEQPIDTLTVSQACTCMQEGHFARGSMLPKIQAMADFVRNSGNTGIITDPEHLNEALAGNAGTHIIPDEVC